MSYNHGLIIFGNVDTAKVIFFDRFDLYLDKFSSSTIGTLGNRAVVLIDMKNLSLRCRYSFALVNYTKAGEISVDADNN